jgi:hypothetical protein
MPPEWLASTVLSAVIDRSGIDPIRIEDVAMARVDGGRASAQELSRPAARGVGLPFAVPGFLTDHRCGSGLQAVITAAMMVRTGVADVVVAGGVEYAADELGLSPMACLRIMTTILHELARTKGAYGLEAIALGHDHGTAALFESAGTTRSPSHAAAPVSTASAEPSLGPTPRLIATSSGGGSGSRDPRPVRPSTRLRRTCCPGRR